MPRNQLLMMRCLVKRGETATENRGPYMATQYLSEHVLLITLPAEPQGSNELEVVSHSAHSAADRDVIVDFSLVEFLPPATIGHLIALERILNAAGRQLVLCSVPPVVQAIFRRLGLHKLFRLMDDEFTALQSLNGSELLYP